MMLVKYNLVSYSYLQAAERQGRYLAKALCYRPTPQKPHADPYIFKPWGMLAYVGDYKALVDTPAGKSQGKTVYSIISIVCS